RTRSLARDAELRPCGPASPRRCCGSRRPCRTRGRSGTGALRSRSAPLCPRHSRHRRGSSARDESSHRAAAELRTAAARVVGNRRGRPSSYAPRLRQAASRRSYWREYIRLCEYSATLVAPPMSSIAHKRMNVFERYLSLWVALCMAAGVMLGKLLPDSVHALQQMEFGTGSQINIPIAILVWLMIYPMMLRIDFGSILRAGRKPKGLLITVVVNWLVKPFSMVFFGWLFFRHLFLPLIGPELASQYVAGVIILAAAPCTAMVFVWSYLSDGDPAYTLVQVSVNDLIML